MNKRKIACDSSDAMPNPKQIKLVHNCAHLLDGIDFIDFDDEFTSSEGTSEDQVLAECKNPAVTNLVYGNNFNNSQERKTDKRDDFLDLSAWKRCIIDEYDRDKNSNDLIIFGHEDKIQCDVTEKVRVDGKKMKCRLQQFWSQCRIEVGVVVSLKAVWEDKHHSYCINNSEGLIVVRPDFLISGTTIVGGLFCMRKAVLQERFKGIGAGVKMVCLFQCISSMN